MSLGVLPIDAILDSGDNGAFSTVGLVGKVGSGIVIGSEYELEIGCGVSTVS